MTDKEFWLYTGMAVYSACNVLVWFLTIDDIEWELRGAFAPKVQIVLAILFWTIPLTLMEIWRTRGDDDER